ncbi:hypothetical protein DOY81_013525 [Sarcophaga bullata]|nr:hypothetical protein DOY81_013525 [Sarcophaga bullata]
MFKKYGIYCENCNVLLNNEDDILGSNLGKLYHSTCMQLNHGKSADCQQLMLFRMNLKFADTPTLTTEAEEQNIEHNNSNNGLLQYVQELKAKIKTLEDALLQAKSDANKLTDCVQTAENNNTVDKALDGGNNITQDSNANKQTHNENNLSSCEQHNVVSASEEHHTCTIVSEDKQEVLDLRLYLLIT